MKLKFRIPWGPDGAQMVAGMYAGCQSFPLLLSPSIIEQESFHFLRNFPHIALILGLTNLGYAGVTLTCLFFGTARKRAALAGVGMMMWTFLGIMMIAGSWWEAHFASPSGLFELCLAIASFATLIQLAQEYPQ